jgi:outer membrane protein OmpU
MRKILLATTALVGFAVAGAAQAATSPLNVTVGGSVDFVAGAFHESRASGATNSASGDFETIYSLAFGATGKTCCGIEYGGNLVLDNEPFQPLFDGNSNNIYVSTADIFMSGAFGKVQLGDARGATDMAVVAPSVGGTRYIDFLDGDRFAKTLVVGIEGKDHSTNATYYTPKFGNDTNKVQLGVTYVPNFRNYGSTVQLTNTSTYKNMFKGVAAYTGTVKGATVGASANIVSASSDAVSRMRDFTSWGLGAQVAYDGFTLGGTYTDLGHHSTNFGAVNKTQNIYTAGLKYEISKVAVGFNYIGSHAYSLDTYVKTFNNYNLGSAYTWAPGLTSNVDGVLFEQKLDNGKKNDGYVLLVSQKLAF